MSNPPVGHPRITLLVEEDVLSRRIFRWVSITFQFQRYDGTICGPVEHMVLDRGDSVGMLLHDVPKDEVILVEQVRIATIRNGPGFMIEIPAGRITPGDEPEPTALREIDEETGAPSAKLELISSYYPSPGGCSERLHLFYAPYPDGLEIREHAGLADEDEDIRVLRVPLNEALQQVADGTIVDGKTIIGLYWLGLRRHAR